MNSWPGLDHPVAEVEGNNTLDAANDLGFLAVGQSTGAVGTIGNGAAWSTDTDWYHFTLDHAARLRIDSLPGDTGATSQIVLNLYRQLIDFDPATPLGYRLVSEAEASPDGGNAAISLNLAAGDYYLAVSGAGNRYFHPFLADSGLAGMGGDYGLLITATTVTGTNPSTTANREGSGGDDTAAKSTNLGDLTSVGVLQVSGTIGDDPFYRNGSSNSYAANPAADVDLYHFEISGDGRYGLVADAFAGRIGSALDPALSLYQMDSDGHLVLVASNDNTLNSTFATDGSVPLFTDSVLYAGLSAGDYYLAVSSSGNDPASGPDGVFNPNITHSGTGGFSTGRYVINLHVEQDNAAPEVVSSTIADGATLDQPPVRFTVQFSKPVNLQQLAYQAFQQPSADQSSPVFIVGSDGSRYVPRFESYDPATQSATFLMLDGLVSGTYELHLSGLADAAGLPLVGNGQDDYVVHFTVAGPDRGYGGNPLIWMANESNDSFENAQDLGTLFPHELQATATIERQVGQSTADHADYFRFTILQSQVYAISLTNVGVGDPQIELLDADGNPISLVRQGDSTGLQGGLLAGTYVLRVGDWNPQQVDQIAYQVHLQLVGVNENPTALTSGAAPAVGIQLVGAGESESLPVAFVRIPETSNSIVRFASFTRNSSIGSLVAEQPKGLNQGLRATPLGDAVLHAVFDDQGKENAFVHVGGSEVVDLLLASQTAEERHIDRPDDALVSSPGVSERTEEHTDPDQTAAEGARTEGATAPATGEANQPEHDGSVEAPSQNTGSEESGGPTAAATEGEHSTRTVASDKSTAYVESATQFQKPSGHTTANKQITTPRLHKASLGLAISIIATHRSTEANRKRSTKGMK